MPKNEATIATPTVSTEVKVEEISNPNILTKEVPKELKNTLGNSVSALSLSSIKAKKELLEVQKSQVSETVHLPNEPFNETDMLLQWTKYAQRLSDKGYKIMESLLLINDPVLKGTQIIHELPNEGSKIDFEKEKPELLGYLRGKLHNHDITIEVVVNESISSKKAFTSIDKFNRLNEINPNLALLKKTFDLDV